MPVHKVGIGAITRKIEFHPIFSGWTYFVIEYAAFFRDTVMSERRKRIDQDEEQCQTYPASSSWTATALRMFLWRCFFIMRHIISQGQQFIVRIRLFQEGIPDQRQLKCFFLFVNDRHGFPSLSVMPLSVLLSSKIMV